MWWTDEDVKEFNRWRLRKNLTALVLALLVGGLFFFIYQLEKGDGPSEFDEVNNHVMELEAQKRQLKNQLDDLSREFEGMGTMELLFLEPRERVFEEAYPLIEEKGLKGVVCVRPDMLPSMDGFISMESFYVLRDSGWETCVYYDGMRDINEYLNELRDRMNEMGLEIPIAMFCPSRTYSEEYNESLVAQGIHYVVTERDDVESDPRNEALWVIKGRPFNGSNVKREISDIIHQCENVAECADFINSGYAFSTTRYTNFLNYLEDDLGKGSLVVAGFEEARLHAIESEDRYNEFMESISDQVNALNAQIGVIEAELRNIRGVGN